MLHWLRSQMLGDYYRSNKRRALRYRLHWLFHRDAIDGLVDGLTRKALRDARKGVKS